MGENGENPVNIEIIKPKVLYRGSKEKIDLLKPQPLLETEKHRFPEGTESVVFASQYKQEALAYSIASRNELGYFLVVPFWKNKEEKQIGWKLELGCKSTDLPTENTTYLYEIDPKNFSLNSAGEWYSTIEVQPNQRIELTTKEALREFDKVEFAK